MPNFLDRLKAAFGSEAEAAGPSPEVAVAALLLEAARADDVVVEDEQRATERALELFLGVDAAGARALVDTAEKARADAADIVRFTRAAKTAYNAAGRERLIEAVWRVVLADDETTPDEDAYVRRLAGLLHVTDTARGAARHRVLAERAQS